MSGAKKNDAAMDVTGARMRRSQLFFNARDEALEDALIAAEIIYGLVNVRTDGERILCATRNERDLGWETRVIHSRF